MLFQQAKFAIAYKDYTVNYRLSELIWQVGSTGSRNWQTPLNEISDCAQVKYLVFIAYLDLIYELIIYLYNILALFE